MKAIAICVLAASVLAGCGPSREKVLASYDATAVVGRPDTVVVRRAPSGATSPHATEAGMLLAAAKSLGASGFKRFVVVKTGVVESRPAVVSYILSGFQTPYEPPSPIYASFDSDVMVARGLRSYEPSFKGAVDIAVISRKLADAPLYP